MNDLPDSWQNVLRALVKGTLAWQTPAQLARGLGLDIDSTHDVLAGLDVDGWVDPWEMGTTLYVTLSPLAAERARVRLTPVGSSDGMRWITIDEPASSPRARGCSDEDRECLDRFVDPSPGADLLLEATERDQRIAGRKSAAGDPRWHHFLPRPTILLGLGLTPWPGPRQQYGPGCAGCGSRPISESAYCLICDRWGLDHVLAARIKAGRPARVRGGTNPILADRCPKGTIPLSSPPARGEMNPNSPGRPVAQSDAAREARKARRRRKRAHQAEQAKLARKANPNRDPRQDGPREGAQAGPTSSR